MTRLFCSYWENKTEATDSGNEVSLIHIVRFLFFVIEVTQAEATFRNCDTLHRRAWNP